MSSSSGVLGGPHTCERMGASLPRELRGGGYIYIYLSGRGVHLGWDGGF